VLDRLLWTSLLAAACELRGEGSRKKVPSWIRVVNKSAFRGKRGGDPKRPPYNIRILFGSVSFFTGRILCSLPLSFFSVRYRFLGRSHFARLALISLCRSHVSLFALIFWFPIILCRSHVYWFAIIFLGSLSFYWPALIFDASLSFYWPALIFDASLSFFFAALIFLCRYHFLWFALVFLARSCFDSSVLAALKMQPPRSWISKTCLGVNFGRANIDIRGRYHFGSVALTALNLKT
jgi:hypothetical protein